MKNYLSIKKTLFSTLMVLFVFVTAQAVEVTVNFTTSTGDPIVGSQVDFRESGGTFSFLGTTDVNGQVIAEVGTVIGHATFKVYYDDVTRQKSQDVNVDPIVNFSTVLSTFKVVDLLENELLGTNAQYKAGGIWKTFGSGTTTTTHELLPGGYAFRVTYEGVVKDLTFAINATNNEVKYVVTLITVKLLDSEGNDIVSDNIQYLDNGSWVQFGDGSTPETVELLPSSAKFRVFYNGAYQQINQNLGTNPIVTFQTVNVNYQSSGLIQYSFGGGPLMTYNAPLELLPVIYRFKFTEEGYPDREFTKPFTASEEKSLAYVHLTNSMGMPIQGANIEFDLDGWTAGASTDASGVSFNLLEGSLGDVNTRVSYAGNTNELEQNLASNSYIDFSTVAVTMKLLSSSNVELASDNAEYSAGSWMTFGDGVTTETVELLRGDYDFKVYYAGAFEEQSLYITSDETIIFNTVEVSLNLFASNGDEATSSNAIFSPYTSTVYQTFGTGVANETMELLPQNYKFRLYYGGAMKQINKNVGNSPVVNYYLTAVTVQLLDTDDNELTSTNITYFITGNGWNQFSDGVTTATYDLLPAFYDFRVYYNGDVMQKAQQIGNNPVVTFVYDDIPALVAEANDEIEILSENVLNETTALSNDNLSYVDQSTPVLVKNGGNYPNPFSHSTVIEYEVITQSDLTISVFNMDGRLVKTLVRAEVYPGNYRIEFDGTDQNGNLLPGGTYIYRLSGVDFQETKRMIIQR